MENVNWNSFFFFSSAGSFRFLPLDTMLYSCLNSINCSEMRLCLECALSFAWLNFQTKAYDKNVIYFFVLFYFLTAKNRWQPPTEKYAGKKKSKFQFKSNCEAATERNKKKIQWSFCVNCPLDGKTFCTNSWYTRIHVELSPPMRQTNAPAQTIRKCGYFRFN